MNMVKVRTAPLMVIGQRMEGENMKYKEFKIFGILFAITKIGIRIITKRGCYGFNIDKLGLDIHLGFTQKCFYWKAKNGG